MKTYLIGYDLNRPGQGYEELIQEIKEISGSWWHNLDSTWIIKSEKTAVEIRDLLKAHLDKNDELLVVKLSGESAWTGFSEKGSSWLLKNILPS